MVTAAQIAELLAERRFDPSIAPQLESYVNEQVKGGTHDLEANLALLRFYQYNPSTTQVPIVAKVRASSSLRRFIHPNKIQI
jgi:translation initiation factor 3 subunit K